MPTASEADERSLNKWNLTAALLFTISLTMLLDLAHRLLSADPNSIVIEAISIQAALALAASTTLWNSGSPYLKKQGHNNAKLRCALAAIAFLMVALVWKLVPARLAEYYLAHGYALESLSDPKYADPSEAMRNYQRAVALNPELEPAHVNLGEVLEHSYRYDEAADEYREAIVVDRTDPIPYNNLARVLLVQGKSLTALQIAEDGLTKNLNADTTAALIKNKAWAEYELGFYDQAIDDAKRPHTAAAACILGKAYLKEGRKSEADAAWAMFKLGDKAAPGTASALQPDCQLLAEVIDKTK